MTRSVSNSLEVPCEENIPVQSKRRGLKRALTDARLLILFMLGVISLVLGVVGFHKYFLLTGEQKSLATAIYDSFYLFTIEAGNLTSPIPWELEVARWLSPAIAMYAILLGFAAIFRDQVRLMSLRFLRNHVVICGLGQKGLNIARSFRNNRSAVVIIELDGNNPNIAACREFGAVVLTGDARDEYLLEKAGVRRARYLIGVCGEDGVNSDVAVIARRLVANRKGSKLNCTIHIKDPNLWKLLRTQEFSAETSETFRLDIFNVYDQGAKQLFREFLFSSGEDDVGAVPHLLVVGFGLFAEQLILNAARKWSPQFDRTDQKLNISIVDPQADIHINRLCHEYSLVEKVCAWESLNFGIDSVEFLRAEFLFDQKRQPEVSMVYVMVEDENLGLSSALTMLERLRGFPVRVLVRMNEEKGLASLIRSARKNAGIFDRLLLFGLMERTCKLNLIYNSSHEAIARAIHEEYLRQEALKGNLPGSSSILVPWDCLPEEYREMNRTQADSIGTKLNAIHCEIVPWSDYGGDKFTFTPAEVELMSVLEHERWCAQRRKQGWVYGPVRNDKLKLHPSLVPYGDPGLSDAEKEKDRNTVRQIPYFLALAGYQIYRL